jgi:hypothetical protein
LFIDFTPFVPLSLKERGKVFIEEGLAPLLNAPLSKAHYQGERRERL